VKIPCPIALELSSFVSYRDFGYFGNCGIRQCGNGATGRGVNILGRLFTRRIGDMVYTMAKIVAWPALSEFMKMRYLAKGLDPAINTRISIRTIKSERCSWPISVMSRAFRGRLHTSGSSHDHVAPDGLLDLKRTPHGSQYAASPQIENVVLSVRKRSRLGARKLKALPEILLSILHLFCYYRPGRPKGYSAADDG